MKKILKRMHLFLYTATIIYRRKQLRGLYRFTIIAPFFISLFLLHDAASYLIIVLILLHLASRPTTNLYLLFLTLALARVTSLFVNILIKNYYYGKYGIILILWLL